MSAGWDDEAWAALQAELDAWRASGRRATFWWRDDDAGASHPGFDRLLALSGRLAVPLGVAVVPAWLTEPVATALRAAPRAVAVLQHGWAHANHETTAAPGETKVRPAECGPARPAARVLAELAAGRVLLAATVGPRLLPVLVPPWNRIAPAVVAGLRDHGYGALSAFGPRPAEAETGLRHLNCHVDPIRWREDRRFVGGAVLCEALRTHLRARRTDQADPREPTGLLTHHRDLDPAAWRVLETLLSRLLAHPAAAFPPVPTLLRPDPDHPPGDASDA